MRGILLISLAGLLLPQIGWAQLFGGNQFESGSYVLNDSRGVRRQGQLKLQSGSKLVVKSTDGKIMKLKPEQVYAFRIGSQKYVTASNFHLKGGLGGAEIEQAFVEQLDSGQIVLLRYDYLVSAPMMIGTGGAMSYGGASSNSAYLLRGRYGTSVTAVQKGNFSSGGRDFRDAVRPFLAARPDLAKLLDEKRINIENLPAAIHALNNNLPFTPSAALNLE